MNEQYRKKVFYKKDGILSYETRIGLLYEVPNAELLRELERRIQSNEILIIYDDIPLKISENSPFNRRVMALACGERDKDEYGIEFDKYLLDHEETN